MNLRPNGCGWVTRRHQVEGDVLHEGVHPVNGRQDCHSPGAIVCRARSQSVVGQQGVTENAFATLAELLRRATAQVDRTDLVE